MKRIVLACVSFAMMSGAALAQSSRDSDRRSDRYGDTPQFIDPPPSQWAIRPGAPSPSAPVPGTANPYATVPGVPHYWGTTAGAPNPADARIGAPNPWEAKVGAPNPADAKIGAPNPWATTPGTPGTAPSVKNPTTPRHRHSDERMTSTGRR